MDNELYEATELLVQEIERIDAESRVAMEDYYPDLVSLKDHAKDMLNKTNGGKNEKPGLPTYDYMAIRETP